MITTYVLNDERRVVSPSLAEIAAMIQSLPRRDHSALWIDLLNPTEDEEHQVLHTLFGFHPLAISDCRREKLQPDRADHLPKVEDYGSYLFAIVNPLSFITTVTTDEHEITTRQLNAFLGEWYVITHHYEDLPAVRQAEQACLKNPSHFSRGPDFVYHLVLDAVVDGYSPILDQFDELIDGVQEEIFERRSAATLHRILSLKREIFHLRRITVHQREMVYRLARGEFSLVNVAEIAYYRNVYDHLVRAADLAESFRDVLTGLLDAYLSTASNRLNEIMKVLAVISTFFLPLTFIAGLYGMNFHFMPELGWRFGYPMALTLMAGTAFGMWIYFRRRGWL